MFTCFWKSKGIHDAQRSPAHTVQQDIGKTVLSGKTRIYLLAILCALLPGLVLAEAIPRGGPNDSRVRMATYQEAQLYRLNVSLTHVTTVELGEGESIRSIIAGDTEGFEIDGVPGGQAFAIKPVARAWNWGALQRQSSYVIT